MTLVVMPIVPFAFALLKSPKPTTDDGKVISIDRYRGQVFLPRKKICPQVRPFYDPVYYQSTTEPSSAS